MKNMLCRTSHTPHDEHHAEAAKKTLQPLINVLYVGHGTPIWYVEYVNV